MTFCQYHFVGIGGVGMAALAALLKDEGAEVDGCDLQLTPRTAWLEARGIAVALGHDVAHLTGREMVVWTGAVHKDNPEVKAAGERAVRRGELLARIIANRPSIAVCGSHGKTTTATFIVRLLAALGEDVAWVIGGETGSFAGYGRANAKAGAVPLLVVEADESDGTLALYHPSMLVITNVDYDHPDYFRTEKEYQACFECARRHASAVVEGKDLGEEPFYATALQGLAEHNRRNALAAIAVAIRRGHSSSAVLSALPQALAALPDRRFQRLAKGVWTDYGHHPTEIRATLAMAKAQSTGALRVIFQPHRYSRTRALLRQFAGAFAGVDELVLAPTYAAFEPPVLGGDEADLYKAVREGPSCPKIIELACSCEQAYRQVAAKQVDGDMTLLLGAGDIIALAKQLEVEVKAPSMAAEAISEGIRGVFESPKGDSAQRLLSAADVGALRVGGARVAPDFVNAIEIDASATLSDVVALLRLLRNAVYFKFGVRLEYTILTKERLHESIGNRHFA